MFKSPLFRRFFFIIISAIIGFTVVIYAFAVPYVKKTVYAKEENTARTILNNIYELVRDNHVAIEAYKESVLGAHKRELKNIVLFEETFIKNKYEQFKSGLLTEAEAKRTALEELREFRYGNNDFVWVADYNGIYLSHPDPEINMSDFSEVRDVFGNLVLMPSIEMARLSGEGYRSYWWQRLGEDLPAEKLTYVRLFPEWDWVLGTGVFLDDLEAEVILRREKMIEELRKIFARVTKAHSGDMYIFDSWMNIIIHPGTEMENTNMAEQKNPETGHPLAEDLMAASRGPDHKLLFKWDRPTDPGNFVHDKIAWVKYVDGFDWYIVFSVYNEDLNASANKLRDRLLIFATAAALLSMIIVSVLVGRLIVPIRRLSETAGKVEDGDLTARCDVNSRDEIGFLATAFNSMVGQLKSHIEQLDQKVLERTRELDEKNDRLENEVRERKRMQDAVSEANKKLKAWVDKLEQHNLEISLLNRMGEMLQASNSLKQTYRIVAETMSGLFPYVAGALFMTDEDGQTLRQVSSWGGYRQDAAAFSLDDCQALRRGKPHRALQPGEEQACEHICDAPPFYSLCLPLTGQDEVLGMLHIFCNAKAKGQSCQEVSSRLDAKQQLIATIVDHLSMAQANLKLRERLHHLSVRDGLTGLFNRRYLEETLRSEIRRADRKGSFTGVILLDVDFFKKFNDTYGHEAGDVVLIELGKLLVSKVREEDVVCRYGGEEFVVILPDSPLEQVGKRAELIRKSVAEELKINYHGQQFNVTISVGVADYPIHGSNSDDVLNAADKALYQAKAAGRNRVVVNDVATPAETARIVQEY